MLRRLAVFALAAAATGSCDNEPTKKWAKKSKTCEGERAWIEKNKKDVCKKNDEWVEERTCQQTCFDLGSKYAYGECAAAVMCDNEPTKKWAKKSKT